MGNGTKLRIDPRASTSPLRGYAQHERPFSARPERSEAKSKDERNANFTPLPGWAKARGIEKLELGCGCLYQGCSPFDRLRANGLDNYVEDKSVRAELVEARIPTRNDPWWTKVRP